MVDVAIIGLGITGAACARSCPFIICAFWAWRRKTTLPPAPPAPTAALLHAGYDAKPGTNKAKYNVRGNALYPLWARELEFPFIQNGSLIVCHDDGIFPAFRLSMTGEYRTASRYGAFR